jgi:peptidoglycan-associated lipoprotein
MSMRREVLDREHALAFVRAGARASGRTAALVFALVLAACAAQPPADAQRAQRLVTRTPDKTVWTTAEAEAAAAAAAQAPRPAAGRAAAAAPARPAAAAAQAASAAAAPGAGAPAPASAAPAAPAVAATPTDTGLIYFDFDSFEIRDAFRPLVEARAKALVADRDRHLVVEGHADERGGAEYNLALGQRRAEAVVKALLLLGVSHIQLEPVSFGDTRPVARGKSEEAWARNRRAELIDR